MEYTQTLQTKLRRRILSEVGADPNLIADIYVSRIHESTQEFGSKQLIRRELEAMIRERLLVETSVVVNGKKFDNISLPTYRLHGRLMSIRQIVASPHNHHGHVYNVVRNRLLAGLTPEQALGIGTVGRGQLRAAVEDWTKRETQSDFLP